MKYTGKIHKFGADVDTDAIIPARYLNTFDPRELAKHCMEDADPTFPERVQPGDIIVADKNFGCGSSRSMLPSPSRPPGFPALLPAPLRIFYRNSINIGLAILECEEAYEGMEEGDQIEVDLETGRITNLRSGISYYAWPSPFMQEIVARGGLINYVKDKAAADNGQ